MKRSFVWRRNEELPDAVLCAARGERYTSPRITPGLAFLKRARATLHVDFVRWADEIVDTFHDHDKAALFADFKRQTYEALEIGLSLNPVLHAFQDVVRAWARQYADEVRTDEASIRHTLAEIDGREETTAP